MTDIAKPTVHEALQAVAQDVGHIAKAQKNASQGFKFRGIDDVLNAIHQPLATHGVAFIPTGADIVSDEERKTRSGASQFYVRALVRYRIVGPGGDHIDAAVLAEAADTGDKVSSKLMSMAYKYLAFQVLSIPVEGMDDADATTPEPVAPEPALTTDDALASIQASADKVGKTLTEVTAKFREQNGGIAVEELPMADRDALSRFARQLAKYVSSK